MSDEALIQAGEQLKAGKLSDAAATCRAILDRTPDHVGALNQLAAIELRLGHRHRAAKLLERVVALAPSEPAGRLALGRLRAAFGDHAGALEHYAKAIELDPGRGEAYGDLARSFYEQRRFGDAEAVARRGLALDAGLVDVRFILGSALAVQGKLAEAAACFRAVVAARPTVGLPYMHLANALEDPAEAIAFYRQALALDPGLRPIHRLIGEALRRVAGDEAALPELRRAVELVPGDADAWAQLGAALRRVDRGEARRCLERALTLDARHLGALVPLIELMQWDGAFEAATETFERLVGALPERVKTERTWQVLAEILYLDAHRPLPPALYDAVARQLEGVVMGRVAAFGALPDVARPPGTRLRLGYLSANFGDHPIGHVTASLFPTHDRGLFELHGFALRDRSSERQPFAARLRAGFDTFHELARRSPRTVATAIRAAGIDILIDLDAYTGQDTAEILAYRPAPLQVAMIGHLNGLDIAAVDYLISDAVVVPPGEEARHREQVVRMPVTLHCADRHAIATPTPSRAACGLPAKGFVFGGFARPDKLDAAILACWLRILAAVEGSVLWLSAAPSASWETNVRARAVAHGVDPARLVFAPRVDDKAQHLARTARCDLLLDTPVFNAATTALDALWAGVPVLALKGDRHYSRVSASLLGALGMPELICDSLGDYERRAIALAQSPAQLAALRAAVATRRTTAPLFDIDAYTRALELAFIHMWRRHAAGEPPRGFALAATPLPPEAPPPAPPAPPGAPAAQPKRARKPAKPRRR